jgi:hypothetical protein
LPALYLDSNKNPSLNKNDCNTECSSLSPIKPSIELRRNVIEFPKRNLNFNYLSLFIPAINGEAFIYVKREDLIGWHMTSGSTGRPVSGPYTNND